jgi:hypothetical protein
MELTLYENVSAHKFDYLTRMALGSFDHYLVARGLEIQNHAQVHSKGLGFEAGLGGVLER